MSRYSRRLTPLNPSLIELNPIEAYFLLLVVALAVAFGLRIYLPSDRGLTFHFSHSTRYVPANVIGFWASVAIPIALITLKVFAVFLKKARG
jgi:hypothetical protein